MIRRLQGLFQRYALAHQVVQLPGFEMLDEQGQRIGYLDRVSVAGNRIMLEGWTIGREVHMVLNGNARQVMPSMARADVAEALAIDPDTLLGFAVGQHFDEGRCVLGVTMDAGKTYFSEVYVPDLEEIGRASKAMRAPFARDLMRASPHLMKWAMTRSPDARAGIKRALRLSDQVTGVTLFDADLLVPGTDTPPRPQDITIVMPVYNAFDLLEEVLQRIRDNTDLPWRLVMVEDCSSDARVRPFLCDWVAALPSDVRARVTLIENETNLGFIGSVNHGFEIARGFGGHVVLLNSDAFVPKGWATRLLRPIFEDADVATVTPMSNDAEICNTPVICVRHDLKPGEADAIDAFAGTLNPSLSRAEVPTGVGFCMAMNRRFLDKVPQLDTAFGRGYGEEVDWCQKVRAQGGRHEVTGSLFVEHRGGVSFGSAEKLALVQKNNELIENRYRGYDLEIQQFIQRDPLSGPRMMLALAWAQARQKGLMPIYMAHSMGGGAEDDLGDRIKSHIGQGSAVLVVRVGGEVRWHLELHTHMGVQRCFVDEEEVLHRMLAIIKGRRVIYSNGVGHYDPIALPEMLLALKNGPADRLEVLLHDFLVLSPSYTLLNCKGVYEGVPAVDTVDKQHQVLRPDGVRASLSAWRKAWGAMLTQADEVVVFSQNSADLFAQAYPDQASLCVVKPHQPKLDALKIKKADQPKGDPVIGVLGNIGYQKGAAILQKMSVELAQSGAAGLVVVGDIDPSFGLTPPAIVHGRYDKNDLPDIVRSYGITAWLIPSVWPETFSFTTHEVLATGMPVFGLDLGAQAEAIARAENGHVIPLPNDQGDLPAVILKAMLMAQD